MKKTTILISLLLVAGMLTSCNTKGSNEVYYDSPAIFYLEGSQPMIKTMHGPFIAPMLANADLFPGDHLMTLFIVNPDNQPYQGYSTVTSMVDYIPIGCEFARSVAMIEDDTEPMQSAGIHPEFIDLTLFFGFTQEATKDQKFSYELVYNTEDLADDGHTPFLYLVSKKTGPPTGAIETIINCFAFDMTNFISYMKELDKDVKKVTLYFKYKTINYLGEEEYKSFENPIEWQIPQ